MTTDSPTFFPHVGKAITVLRLLNDLSQAELAQRCGIRANQISRYETGQVLPQLPQLARLFQAFDLRPVQFFLVVDHMERIDTLVGTARTAAPGALRNAVTSYWDRVAATEHELLDRMVEATLELFDEPQPPDDPDA